MRIAAFLAVSVLPYRVAAPWGIVSRRGFRTAAVKRTEE
jgi:hypothetical protein